MAVHISHSPPLTLQLFSKTPNPTASDPNRPDVVMIPVPALPTFPAYHLSRPHSHDTDLQKQEPQGSHNRSTPNYPATSNDSHLVEPPTHIIRRMSDSIDGMENQRPRNRELQAGLDRDGQAGEGGDQRGRLQVPAGQGRGEVGEAVAVEQAGETHAGEALPDGAAEVGLLLVVDLQVGGDGALEALGVEDGFGVGLGEVLGCYGAVVTGERLVMGGHLGNGGGEGRTGFELWRGWM